jgi:tetratricopeptide (TPR) repeat protein
MSNDQTPIDWPTLVVLALVLAQGLVLAQSVRSAQMLEGAGQLAAAFDEYRLVVAGNPQDRLAFSGLVRLAHNVGRSDTLLALSRRLLATQPDQPEFALGVVEGLFGLRRRNEALAELRRAAKRWPAHASGLAEVAARHEARTEAVALYRQARQLAGADQLYAERLISLHEELGQYQAAVREVVQLLNRRPDEIHRWSQKLSSYAGKTDLRVLIAELEKLDSPRTRARAQAAVLTALGRSAEAARLLKSALSDQELSQLAQEWESEGRLESALAVYQVLASHTRAAQVLRRLGRTEQARQALALDQGVGAQLELGELLLDAGDCRAAAEAYEKVLRQRPNHAPALLGMSRARLGMGEPAQARAFIRRIERLQDQELLLLARSFLVEGRFDSAADYARRVVRVQPQSALANDGLELLLLLSASRSDSSSVVELARAMAEPQTGAYTSGTRRVVTLAHGRGPVAEAATLLSAQFLLRQGRPQDALIVLDSFPQRFPSSPLRPRAMLEAARVLSDGLNDPARSRRALEALVLEYPGSPYAPIARSLLAGSPPASPTEVR